MNITPDSFSDGGEFFSTDSIVNRLQFLKQFEVIDIGAESTAPQNASISHSTEWDRWEMVLPFLKDVSTTISADTYHPETIFKLLKYWKDHKLKARLVWNDVSGKFDDSVREYLLSGFDYIFCHNLAPDREHTGQHMDFVATELDLVAYFREHRHPQVIFDPCLGFSKTYEQNWAIIEGIGELQNELEHNRWLIGFSRKSFLRKKYSLTSNNELDQVHAQEVKNLLVKSSGEVWIRTHRPELLHL